MMMNHRKEVMMEKEKEHRCFICDCVLTEENVVLPEILEDLEIRAVVDGMGSLNEIEQVALYFGICLECLENGELP